MRIEKFPQWRRSQANHHFALCGSYPEDLVVPSKIPDSHLSLAANQRSSKRLPVLTWIHPLTGAALCRSSQPLVGMTTAACPEDEKLLMAIRSSVLPPDDERANFCCNELELSTDDISAAQGESQWTEVLPRSDDHLQRQGSLRSFPKSKICPRQNLGQPPTMRAQGAQTSLPHAISVPNIESLLTKKESAVKNSKKIVAAVSHPLEIPESLTETEDGSDVSSDEEDRRQAPGHMSSSSYARVSRDLRDLRPPSDAPHRLRIIDARPMMNAKGNALMGKGHEIIGRLGGDSCTTLDFADIPNIHVVRDSLGALRQIISEASGNPNWFQLIHDTKWLLYVSLILKAAIRVALHLESGEPVLIHCSDGWDRTSQLTALAQLILSPHYRTIEGLVPPSPPLNLS
jgi:hypothetical protein